MIPHILVGCFDDLQNEAGMLYILPAPRYDLPANDWQEMDQLCGRVDLPVRGKSTDLNMLSWLGIDVELTKDREELKYVREVTIDLTSSSLVTNSFPEHPTYSSLEELDHTSEQIMTGVVYSILLSLCDNPADRIQVVVKGAGASHELLKFSGTYGFDPVSLKLLAGKLPLNLRRYQNSGYVIPPPYE